MLPAEGWWPKISYPYVLAGNRQWWVANLVTDEVLRQGEGWQHGFISPNTFVISRTEPGQPDEMRTVYTVTVGEWIERPVYTGWVGNNIVTAPDHIVWATPSNVVVNGRIIADGSFLPQSPSANATLVAITEKVGPGTTWDDYRVLMVKDGRLFKRNISVGNEFGNIVIPTPGANFTFGYFGPSFINIDGRVTQVNATPKQGPWLYVQDDWGVVCAERGDATPGILAGPLYDKRVAQRWGINATWVDAQQIGPNIHVVASGDRGQFTYVTFNIDEPRSVVDDTTPPPPPMPEPKVTITSYEPQSGSSPLKCKAVWAKESGSGPIEAVIWLYRREGNSTWGIAAINDPADPDHTYTFPEGRWEIALRATGPGGEAQTGRKRLVVVEGVSDECIRVSDRVDVGNGPQVVKHIILVDGVKVVQFVGDEPPPPPPPSGKLDGNFLAFPGFEFAFVYPSWSASRREAFRRAYRAAGHNWLPLSPWCDYRGKGTYDFATNPDGFNDVIEELQNDGITVCVMCYTDGFNSSHPRTLDETKRWASSYIPRLRNMRMACTGWEFNQINGSEWTGDGTKHIEWAKHLKGLLPSGVPLYAHFSPERITGWPNYPDHSGPQDEAGWWKGDNPLDGLLYQRRPDEPLPDFFDHTLGGNGDVGDVNRIAGSYWGLSGLKFIVFEHSRDIERYKAVVVGVQEHPLVSGWC
jgi:hypothetical protein